jgi:hypothetical protein
MKPGDLVRWKECPPAIWMFAETRVRRIEGNLAWIEWIHHPVPMSELAVLKS